MGWIPLAVDQASIGHLEDVDTSGVTDDQVLRYDEGQGLWLPGDAGAGGGGGNASHAETIGDNSNTTLTVTHNLGTTDIAVQLWDITGSDPVEATGDADTIEAVGVDAIDITFSVAPATDSYRVVLFASGGGATNSSVRVSDPSGANQAIAVGTWTAVTFDTEDFDTAGYADLGSDDDRVTIPSGQGGLFLMGAGVETVGASNTETYLAIWRNGVNVGHRVVYTRFQTFAANPDRLTVVGLDVGDAGDFYSVGVLTSGGADVVRASYAPYLWVVRLGGAPA